VSIPRLLGIIALVLFIVFVATFFSVLVRLARVGIETERRIELKTETADEEGYTELIETFFELREQDHLSGNLRFHVSGRVDTRSEPFASVEPGQTVLLRIENNFPELESNQDLFCVFPEPPSGDNFVNLDFGEFDLDVLDRRDFYPFDGYEVAISYAYYTPSNSQRDHGAWYMPRQVVIRSKTNRNFLNPRYERTSRGDDLIRFRVARLRMLHYLTATLILIELLFIIYLLTIVNLQDLMAKGLGYLVGLYIIRNILVTNAPQFPTLIDYATLFLICVVFFLMLFKFLPGEEERALVTLPIAWRDALMGREKPAGELSERGSVIEDDEDDEEELE